MSVNETETKAKEFKEKSTLNTNDIRRNNLRNSKQWQRRKDIMKKAKKWSNAVDDQTDSSNQLFLNCSSSSAEATGSVASVLELPTTTNNSSMACESLANISPTHIEDESNSKSTNSNLESSSNSSTKKVNS